MSGGMTPVHPLGQPDIRGCLGAAGRSRTICSADVPTPLLSAVSA